MDRKIRWVLPSFAVAAAVAALAAPPTIGSGEPANASAPPSASSGPSRGAPPPGALLRGSDIPADAGAYPKGADWSNAKTIALNIGPSAPPSIQCEFKLMGAWLHIACRHNAIGVGLVAGDPKDVKVWTEAPNGGSPTSADTERTTSFAELPIRRGEAHVFTFLATAPGYEVDFPAEGATVQIGWRADAPDPVLVLTEAGAGRLAR